ncbi:adult cuticle protein 1 [Lucilia sericata]|uniref:adult cuticle protein 1 n=1 Tax=Lucilia sericata TaxID=13632 RepID=UPI0018A879D4|nr:adult cuticle protein 1 [Lucilia sericata]
MKFAVVVVLVALALGANASILPGAVVVGHPGAIIAAPGAVAVHAAVPSPVQIVSGPAVVAAPVVVPAPTGTYVAKTRGAVHVAPLPGHIQSAVSANLQPAPGTL